MSKISMKNVVKDRWKKEEWSALWTLLHQQRTAIFPKSIHVASIQFINYFLLLAMKSTLKIFNTNSTHENETEF